MNLFAKRDDFPAVFENAAGDKLIVPDITSCPVGYVRSKLTVAEYEASLLPPAPESAPEPSSPEPSESAPEAKAPAEDENPLASLSSWAKP